jgi:hypothetical protein
MKHSIHFELIIMIIKQFYISMFFFHKKIKILFERKKIYLLFLKKMSTEPLINGQFEIYDNEITELRKKISRLIKDISTSHSEIEKNSVKLKLKIKELGSSKVTIRTIKESLSKNVINNQKGDR